VQSAAADRTNDISFTVNRSELKKAMPILEKVQKELGAKEILSEDKVAKISIIGVGMRSHPGVAAKMFDVLADEGINIEMISTSEIKVACVVREDQLHDAVKALHKAYGLDKKK
jgi:aspartate kinase